MASLGLGESTIIDYLGRARRAGLGRPLPDELTDAALEVLLFPPEPAGMGRSVTAQDFDEITGVTEPCLCKSMTWLQTNARHRDFRRDMTVARLSQASPVRSIQDPM